MKKPKKKILKRDDVKRVRLDQSSLLDALAPKDVKGFKQVSPPIMIRPALMVGRSIQGKIVDVIPSPIKSYKNDILLLENGDKKFAFPITAVLKRILAPNGKMNLATYKGKSIIITGVGVGETQAGNPVNLFEVSVKD